MTEADRIFSLFPPFIQDFIYSNGWEELRELQCYAAHVIMETEDNFLLSSSTSSGKTEAVFFPILSLLSGSARSLYLADGNFSDANFSDGNFSDGNLSDGKP